MLEESPPLVLIGASVRAFAASARRAGWRVFAADLFSDLDLRDVAAATAWARDFAAGYPEGLVAAAASFPPAPFCYLGALENHPGVIRAVARTRSLLGSPPAAVATVRDPWSLRRLARDAGLECPELYRDPHGLPRDGSFLRKPVASAGGRGVVPWNADARPTADACVWQRRIAGEAWSAAYVASAAEGRLVGASRQLTGEDWCHARPFAYCGSIDVPLDALPHDLRRQFLALASPLAACGLRGAIGADFVVGADGAAWVVEVNPRPTASMELVERTTGVSIAAAHVAACGGPAGRSPAPRPCPRRWAKAILYAPRSLAIAADQIAAVVARRRLWSDVTDLPAIADIPPPGRTVAAGGPLCTLFAAGGTEAEAVARLHERAAALTVVFSPPDGAAAPPAVIPDCIP